MLGMGLCMPMFEEIGHLMSGIQGHSRTFGLLAGKVRFIAYCT